MTTHNGTSMPKLNGAQQSSTRASFAGTASSGPDNRGADLSAVAPEKRPPQDPRDIQRFLGILASDPDEDLR